MKELKNLYKLTIFDISEEDDASLSYPTCKYCIELIDPENNRKFLTKNAKKLDVDLLINENKCVYIDNDTGDIKYRSIEKCKEEINNYKYLKEISLHNNNFYLALVSSNKFIRNTMLNNILFGVKQIINAEYSYDD